MRGLAVVIMIQCHTFNSFVRPDQTSRGTYVLSQFVGGMAAPLFLFMAGMTLAFQMDSLERRGHAPIHRYLVSLRRSGYILGIAFAFRCTNYLASLPHADTAEITKVDILNCMGVAMAAFSVAAAVDSRSRARFALAAALAVAAVSPVMANFSWDGVPVLLREYLAAGPGRGRFPFFPCAAYVGFGLAAGAIVKRAVEERLERLMQWSVAIGLALVWGGQYFSNLPYSIYTKSSFWTDSPALILIRFGISLLLMSGSYLWTEFGSGVRWSWVQVLGRNSLMVYWVHVMLVYGDLIKGLHGSLTIPQTITATAATIVLMVALSVAWTRWKIRMKTKQPGMAAGKAA
jgi:uncharacterized membrane protein